MASIHCAYCDYNGPPIAMTDWHQCWSHVRWWGNLLFLMPLLLITLSFNWMAAVAVVVSLRILSVQVVVQCPKCRVGFSMDGKTALTWKDWEVYRARNPEN